MRLLRSVTAASALVAASGCTKTVQAHISNPTKASLETSLDQLDNQRMSKQRMSVGAIAPGATPVHKNVELKAGEELVVTAKLPNSVEVFQTRYTVTRADPDKIPWNVTLDVGRSMATEDPQGVFGGAFQLLGKRVGLERIPVANALNTIFGGFAVVEDAGDGTPAQIVYPIYAKQVGCATDPAKFVYPTRGSSEKVEASGKVLAELSANIPIAGDLSASYSQQTLYQMRWELKNYGPKIAEIPDGWTIEGALEHLAPEQKKTLGNLLKDPKRLLLWVNKIVVVEAGYVELKKGREVRSSGQINAMQYVSGSTVWEFDEKTEKKDLVGSVVVNLGGVPVAFGKGSDRTSIAAVPKKKNATKTLRLGDLEVEVWRDPKDLSETTPVALTGKLAPPAADSPEPAPAPTPKARKPAK